MHSDPSPDTRAYFSLLTALLGPRQPAQADLHAVHRLLIEHPGEAVEAFHYWAARVDARDEGTAEALGAALRALEPSEHVYRVCRALARYAAVQHPHRAAPEAPASRNLRVLLNLWSALTCPPGTARVLRHVQGAMAVDSARAAGHPLFSVAMTRLATPLPTSEATK